MTIILAGKLLSDAASDLPTLWIAARRGNVLRQIFQERSSDGLHLFRPLSVRPDASGQFWLELASAFIYEEDLGEGQAGANLPAVPLFLGGQAGLQPVVRPENAPAITSDRPLYFVEQEMQTVEAEWHWLPAGSERPARLILGSVRRLGLDGEPDLLWQRAVGQLILGAEPAGAPGLGYRVQLWAVPESLDGGEPQNRIDLHEALTDAAGLFPIRYPWLLERTASAPAKTRIHARVSRPGDSEALLEPDWSKPQWLVEALAEPGDPLGRPREGLHELRLHPPAEDNSLPVLDNDQLAAPWPGELGLATAEAAQLAAHLSEHGLGSLQRIAEAGGIPDFEGPQHEVINRAIRRLERHAGLFAVFPPEQDPARHFALARNLAVLGETPTLGQVAAMPPTELVEKGTAALGDFKAAQLHQVALARARLLDQALVGAKVDSEQRLLFGDGNTGIAGGLLNTCGCDDCRSAVSPNAYLADLLTYASWRLDKLDGAVRISPAVLEADFQQPFASLPVSCNAMSEELLQVRLAIETLRGFLGTPADPTALNKAVADHEQRVYTALLSGLGLDPAELRMAVAEFDAGKPDRLRLLAERLGLQSLDLNQTRALWHASNNRGEDALHQTFGYRPAKRPVSFDPPAPTQLETARLNAQSAAWLALDHPPEARLAYRLPGPSWVAAMPLLDPDLIPRNELRHGWDSAHKTTTAWVARRQWIDTALATLAAERAAITVPAPLAQEEASFEAALAKALDATPDTAPLYQWLTTRAKRLAPGGDDAAMWTAYKNAASDADARANEAKYFIPQDAYRAFQPLQEAIYAKSAAGIRSAQAAKRTLWINLWEALGKRATLDRLAWIDGKLLPLFNGFKALDPSLPGYTDMAGLLDAFLPLLKLLDLKALDVTVPAQKALRDALAPLIPLRWPDAAAFVRALLDRGTVARDAALRLLDLRAKAALGALTMTDDDWREFDAILVQRQKETDVNGYAAWAAEDYDKLNPGFLDLAPDSRHFQPLLAAYAPPRWLGNDERRAAFLQAWRQRSRMPLVEPVLLVASDFAVRDPAKSPAYKLWQTRNAEVQGLLAAWSAKPRPATADDLDRDFIAAGLAVDPADLPDLALQSDRGTLDEARLDQLGLDVRAARELFRLRALARATGLALETADWDRLFRILTAVQKRRDLWPKWRSEEAEAGLFLDPQVFSLPAPPPIQIPPVSTEPRLPEWLADPDLRADWLDLLDSRSGQRQSVLDSHRAFLLKVDETTLPDLRDALIPVAVAGRKDQRGQDLASQDRDSQTRWLSERLLMDLKLSSCARTTRIGQALESLQTLLRSTYEGIGSAVVVLQDDLRYRFLGINYAQDWKWMGSYALWRSAVFMFLYPENLLLPLLLPAAQQSVAFRDLIESLSSQTISATDACLAAARYADYWNDVQDLQLQATCEAQGAQPQDGSCPSPKTVLSESYVYHFGLAKGGRAYWSARLKFGSPDTPLWAPVPSQLPVREILGCVPYHHPEGTRYLVLFLRVEDKGIQKLAINRFDRDRHPAGQQAWDEEVTPLDDLPKSYEKDLGRVSQVVVVDPEEEHLPPMVLLRAGETATHVRALDRDVKSWDGPDWDSWKLNVARPDGTPSPIREIFYAKIRDFNGLNFLNILYRGEGHEVYGSGYTRMRCLQLYVFTKNGIGTVTYYAGVVRFRYNDTSLETLVAANERLSAVRLGRSRVFLLGVYSGSPYGYTSSTLVNFLENKLLGRPTTPDLDWFDLGAHRFLAGGTLTAFREPLVFLPNSTDLDSMLDGSGRSVGHIRIGDKGELQTGLMLRLNWTWTDTTAEVSLGSQWRVVPLLGVRVPVTEELDEQQLRDRRIQLESAYKQVRGTEPYSQVYLDEAYFFVPLHLALQLQRSGVFDAALKWLRSVLDWRAEGRDRFIAYKLVLDAQSPAGFTRGGGWLDDLNPHSVAQQRQSTYTRFVLITLARLLLDDAGAEFTRETPESLPKADALYELALAVLRSPELLVRKPGCLDLVGELEIEIEDAQQAGRLDGLVRDVARLGDAPKIRELVPQIRQALLQPGKSWDERLLAAETLLETNRPVVTPPRLDELLQREEALQGRAQLAMAARVPDLRARQALTGRAFRGLVTQVTGVTPETLDTRVETGAVQAPRFDWMRLLPDPAAPEPPLGQAFVRLVDREELIGDDFRDRVRFDPLQPTREALEHREIARNPLGAVAMAMAAPGDGGGGGRPPRVLLSFCIVPNPVLKALKLLADLNLYKLRNCRTIAGLERQMDVYGAPTDPESGLPMISATGNVVASGGIRLQSTPYRYSVLVARAQRLASLANQFEQSMLQALEKRDAELYNRLRAQQDLKLQKATLKVRELEVKDAEESVQQANLSEQKLEQISQHLDELLANPISQLEQAQMAMIALAGTTKIIAAMLDRFAQGTGDVAKAFLGKEAIASAAAAQYIAAGVIEAISLGADTSAQILGLVASYERREQEWRHQKLLNATDLSITASQVRQAQLRQTIKERELDISQLQVDHAETNLDFLRTKFTGFELYDWMSGVLQGVYRSLLQQATAMALLAEQQLSFDQQQSLGFIQDDYWVLSPQDGQGLDAKAPDRKGLTGSARLVRDLETMDAFAFSQERRPLQLARTLSLSSFSPAEFQRFRETGLLWFDTPERLFDQDFPGQYMRRVRLVRVTLVALIPPAQGVRASLYNIGPSRVVAPGLAGMETKVLPPSYDMISFSAPAGATGLFELTPTSDLRLPFEGAGVDTSWLFELSRAANPFDFTSIADVLITIEYKAFYSADYREVVIATKLPRSYRQEKGISFRHQLADAWYQLLNPDTTTSPLRVSFDLDVRDFPSNLDRVQMEHILFYVSKSANSKLDPTSQRVFLGHHDAAQTNPTLSGADLNADGLISTRQPNGLAWLNNLVGDGAAPTGRWTVELPESFRQPLQKGEIEDLFLSIAFKGRPQAWPPLTRASQLGG
ncbi:MAG TPA: neuraminidase-like domain-containing protein [Thermoanaerobaculia bacterium]|nr:neuraminidase-like domain-containing protein [Thermoanaerobaculia bacterium]